MASNIIELQFLNFHRPVQAGKRYVRSPAPDKVVYFVCLKPKPGKKTISFIRK